MANPDSPEFGQARDIARQWLARVHRIFFTRRDLHSSMSDSAISSLMFHTSFL